MSNRSTTKTKKPTQIDPLKSIRAQLRSMDTKLNICVNRTEHIGDSLNSIYAQVGQLHSINDKAIIDAYVRGKNDAEAAPKGIEQPWVPQKGDLAVVSKTGAIGPVVRIERNSGEVFYWIGEKEQFGGWLLENLHKPSEAEVSAHKEAEARRKMEEVTELQEGDACDTHAGQQKELLRMAEGHMRTSAPSTRSTRTWFFKEYKGYVLHSLAPDPSNCEGSMVKRWLPYDLFKRLLGEWIEARSKKAREEEAKKPLAFGTRVKYGKVGNAIWMGANGLIHEVAFSNGNGTWKTAVCDRSDFQIID